MLCYHRPYGKIMGWYGEWFYFEDTLFTSQGLLHAIYKIAPLPRSYMLEKVTPPECLNNIPNIKI